MHKYAQCVERPGPGQAISFRAQFVAGNVIYRTNDACIFWHGFAATFYVIHVLPAEHADHAKPNTNSALTFLGCLGKRKTVNKIASRDLRTQVYARARLAENNQLDLYTNTHTHTLSVFIAFSRFLRAHGVNLFAVASAAGADMRDRRQRCVAPARPHGAFAMRTRSRDWMTD